VETHIEEVIEVTHVELQPIEWCVQVRLHTLYDDLEISLLLNFNISLVIQNGFKQSGKGLYEHISQGKTCRIESNSGAILKLG
jgi:hypothetical protein